MLGTVAVPALGLYPASMNNIDKWLLTLATLPVLVAGGSLWYEVGLSTRYAVAIDRGANEAAVLFAAGLLFALWAFLLERIWRK